jgi:hypothetical protein
MLGFGLLTARITWVLSIYPVLSRRRSLAQRIATIREAGSKSALDPVQADPETFAPLLHDLASQLVAVRGDLLQFSVTYYFHGADERSALPATLPDLAHLANTASASGRPPPAVRLAAAALRRSLDDLAQTLASRLPGSPSAETERILYARDRLRDARQAGPVSARRAVGSKQHRNPKPHVSLVSKI